MSTSRFENAIADELLAEIARQRLMHKEVQAAANVKSRAWGYYFIQRTRHLPMPVIEAVSQVLGLKASQVLERAEARLETMPPVDPLTEGLSDRERARLERDVARGRALLEAEDPGITTRKPASGKKPDSPGKESRRRA